LVTSDHSRTEESKQQDQCCNKHQLGGEDRQLLIHVADSNGVSESNPSGAIEADNTKIQHHMLHEQLYTLQNTTDKNTMQNGQMANVQFSPPSNFRHHHQSPRPLHYTPSFCITIYYKTGQRSKEH